MPDLLSTLQTQDLGYLRIVAGFWGLELRAQEPSAARSELAKALLSSAALADEVVASLPGDARQALSALVSGGGQIPWAVFRRTFGEIREMGAGRRDREQPFLRPTSASEALFYRALLARAFLDGLHGPQEFAFLPDDLLQLLAHTGPEPAGPRRGASTAAGIASPPPGRPAQRAEHAVVVPASDRILDDATTYLGALRVGESALKDERLQALLRAARLIKEGQPDPEKTRAFLERDRASAMTMLAQAWRDSETFDELRLVPSLAFEGDWRSPALATRSVLLGLIESIPKNVWWSLPAFIHGTKSRLPDFQRPAGDYDSWFIRRRTDGAYLRGFGSWDEVDGALVHFFVTNILHWLGLVDLGCARNGGEALAFRRIGPGSLPTTPETGKLKVRSDATVSASRNVPRAVRYQVGRFCLWEQPQPETYRYRITPGSLDTAKARGLSVEQLMALLERHADAGIPPTLRQALKRWEAHGTEARAENEVVLRVRTPQVLEKLQRSRAARFLGEALGPTAVIIKAGAQSKVVAALAELGILAENAVPREGPLVPGDDPARPSEEGHAPKRTRK